MDFSLENSYNLKNIAGIDEAGRGPLCAPVFASCVVLDRNKFPKGVNDSKKLTEKKRDDIFDEILGLEEAGYLFYGIGIGTIEEIDEVNIRNATKLAMKRSYEDLVEKYKVNVDLVIVDGNFIPDIDVRSEFVIKGDSKSISIATASIIAKVNRDRLLYELDLKYPQYNWKKNKGYGTREHIDAIKKYGICEYHRKSFVKNFI